MTFDLATAIVFSEIRRTGHFKVSREVAAMLNAQIDIQLRQLVNQTEATERPTQP